MIDLSKFEPINRVGHSRPLRYKREGYDVRVAVNRNDKTGLATVITIYGERNVKKFQDHSVVPYISRDKIIFVIDDERGYAFSQIKRKGGTRNMNYGNIKVCNDKLNLICIANEGKYVLQYDSESKLHYINLKEKIFGEGENGGKHGT